MSAVVLVEDLQILPNHLMENRLKLSFCHSGRVFVALALALALSPLKEWVT